MKKITLAQIRQHNKESGFHTFDSKTLKFFGETMKNYKVGKVREDFTVEIHRMGGKAGNGMFIYYPLTGEVKSID